MRGEAERAEGGSRGRSEGGRERGGRKRGRERGRGELGSSLSLSLSRPLSAVAAPPPLPAPRSAPTDRRQEVPAREGAREGLSGTGGGKGGRLSVRLDGQWLLPATSPHANRLLPLGHGLSRREVSIVPALPGLLVAGGAATFLKEARRANGRRNSVSAGRRHGPPAPHRDPRGVPAQPVPPRPARSLGPSAAHSLGPSAARRAGPGPGSSHRPSEPRVPLRLAGAAAGAGPSPGRCLRRRTDGRTDELASCQRPSLAVLWPLALSCRSLRSPGCAAIAVCPPPSARAVTRGRARETSRPADSLGSVSLAYLNNDNSEHFFLHGRSQHLTLLLSIWTKLKLLAMLMFTVCVFRQNFS
ncbi:uncharacterized protein [Taeniopygia guttata]|uniref:uncharacterized protein n=1 Tax=Taeniopygia guttata TaxID=59729 RepID=UPI003BB91533